MRSIFVTTAICLAVYIGTSYFNIVEQLISQKTRFLPSSVSADWTSLWITFHPRAGGNALMVETPLLRLLVFIVCLFVIGYFVRWGRHSARND